MDAAGVGDRAGVIAAEFRLTAADVPFPHWVMDDFLEPEAAARIAEAFTQIPDGAWYERRHRHSLKWVTRTVQGLPAAIQDALTSLNSLETCWWLSQLTRIHPVISDPEYKGGGCHQSRPGSFLDIHADFTIHEALQARRCLNLLLYLSPEYDDRWGGHLELWDRTVQERYATIEPRFNRAVLFATGATSFHGHPDPMRGPASARRNSLALYYYTPWKEGDARLPTTVYRARPWEVRERLRLWAGRQARRLGLKRG